MPKKKATKKETKENTTNENTDEEAVMGGEDSFDPSIIEDGLGDDFDSYDDVDNF